MNAALEAPAAEIPVAEAAKNRRENNFDALRLVAALFVLLSHAIFIAQGVEKNDPLNWLTGNQSMLGLAGDYSERVGDYWARMKERPAYKAAAAK